jgi:two-component system, OmpR family, phosphate regulon sensor histidine kinase PhoR
MNPVMVRAGVLLVIAVSGFLTGLFTIRRMRKNLEAEAESMSHIPLAAEGLPVHAYHAVIQELKQQKHQLIAEQLSERRKAKAAEALSATIFSNLSCGILFLDGNGLVRQANPAARQILGFASPAGLHITDLLRSATLRLESDGEYSQLTVEHSLAPALAGKSTVHGLVVDYPARDGATHVLEVTASPVLADDAAVMGTTLVLTDKTDIERIRTAEKIRQEISAEHALALRLSLTTIADSAQQLARSQDPEAARRLAEGIAHEAAQLDRTTGSFLGGTRAASAVS